MFKGALLKMYYRVATLWVKKSSLSDQKLPWVFSSLWKVKETGCKAKKFLNSHLEINKTTFFEQLLKLIY